MSVGRRELNHKLVKNKFFNRIPLKVLACFGYDISENMKEKTLLWHVPLVISAGALLFFSLLSLTQVNLFIYIYYIVCVLYELIMLLYNQHNLRAKRTYFRTQAQKTVRYEVSPHRIELAITGTVLVLTMAIGLWGVCGVGFDIEELSANEALKMSITFIIIWKMLVDIYNGYKVLYSASVCV